MNWLWWAQGLAVLISMAWADVCWTLYIQNVTAKRPIIAAAWSASIVLMGSISIMGYVSDHRYLVFAALGAFAGTWWSVKK